MFYLFFGFLILLLIIYIIFTIYIREKKTKIRTYEDIHRTHVRTQNRIQREINARELTQHIRDGVDVERQRMGLPPIYGPNGIRTEMRNRDRYMTEWEGGRLVINSRPPIDPDNRPKEGDIREDCIIANQPEHGVRVYQYHNGRWHLQSTLKPIDFLTDEDMKIK